MLRGPAEILDDGAGARPGAGAARERYPQYRAMNLDGLPVIALRVAHVASWGALSAD